MALIRCPECGREISQYADKCPGCGWPVPKPTAREGNYSECSNYEDSYEETGIDENVVQDALFGMLCGDWAVEDTALESCRVSTFRDAGVMCNDAGLVLRMPDGSEFQITILQSR